jgi:hypothetical protein
MRGRVKNKGDDENERKKERDEHGERDRRMGG